MPSTQFLIIYLLFMMLSIIRSRSTRALWMRTSLGSASTAIPPPGLVGHVDYMMADAIRSWNGSEKAKVDAARCLRSHLLKDYEASMQASSVEESVCNKQLFERAKHLHKACRARVVASAEVKNTELSCAAEELTDGTLGVEDVLSQYSTHLARNRAVYDSIVGRHEGIKAEDGLYSEAASLESYADAAAKMGAKVWVQEANEWMWSFALAYFRRNGARKDFLRHMSPYLARETFNAWEEVLVKDLMLPKGGGSDSGGADPAKIRLLDVGSCYNPIRHSASAPAFDCLAVDLHPAHPSVKQADFLRVGIHDSGDGDGGEAAAVRYLPGNSGDWEEEGVERVESLPAGSFDVVSMSLVLSYLPDPAKRRQMVRRARRLLICPPSSSSVTTDTVEPDSHRAGLLLIAEKQSIFNSGKAQGARNQSDSLVEGWKHAVAGEGFRLVKYRRMRCTDGKHTHLFAFRTIPVPVPVPVPEVGAGGGASRGEMWIRQDYVNDTAGAGPAPSSAAKGQGDRRRSTERHHCARVPAPSDPRPLTTLLHRSLVPPVAVVGGGLGGAALALSLKRAGVPVVVFEKDTTFAARRQGYALTMQQGSSVLDGQLGISMETLLEPGTGVASLTHLSMDRHGQRLGLYGATEEAARRATTPRAARRENKRRHNVHIPRQKLRELLLRGLQEGSEGEGSEGEGEVVRWSKELVDYQIGHKAISIPLQQGHEGEGEGEDEGGGDEARGGDSDGGAPLHAEQPWPVVGLRFADGSSFECSALVGADGIFSRVRALTEQKQRQAQHGAGAEAGAREGLRYLGIMVVLGISPLRALQEGHSRMNQGQGQAQEQEQEQEGSVDTSTAEPQAVEMTPDYSRRQSQWLDGATRVFSMPFGDGEHAMWQLSFPMAEEEALSLSSLRASASSPAPASEEEKTRVGARLKREALRRCEAWHQPLVALLEATAEGDISGHPVYDRDAASIEGEGASASASGGLVMLMGDAAHPMSPFKGQGANQALLDAVSLATELRRSRAAFGDSVTVTRHSGEGEGEGAGLKVELSRGQAVPEALSAFEAEMLARASEKVLRSREAAALLHGEEALRKGDTTRASAAAASTKEGD